MAQIAVEEVVAAAVKLTQTGQWDAADRLLSACQPADPAEASVVALASAEVAVDDDFWRGAPRAVELLDRASSALDAVADEDARWDLDLLRVRRAYGVALFGPNGPDRSAGPDLVGRVSSLRAAAPDRGRGGWASLWGGVMADNLLEDGTEAAARYEEALDAATEVEDGLLSSYALRHLGDHAHTAGDRELARRHWERATELRQEIGHLPGTLAQQMLLAVLASEDGDAPGARSLATEVARWSRSLGLTWLERGAESLRE